MNDYIKTILNGLKTWVNGELDKLKQRFSSVDSATAALDSRVTKAQSTAESAQTAAESAQSTANTAKTTAESAQSTAESAQSTANTAKSTAEGKVSMDDLTSYIELLSEPEKTEAFTDNGRTFYKIGIVKAGLDSQDNNYDRKLMVSIRVNASASMAIATNDVMLENMDYYSSTGSPYYVCYFTNDGTFTTTINNKDETVTVQLAFSNDTARSVLAYCSASLGWYDVTSVALCTDILTKINDVGETANKALPKSGGTMTGVLTLKGNPTGDNDAANKAYVDAAVADTISETRVNELIDEKLGVIENGSY